MDELADLVHDDFAWHRCLPATLVAREYRMLHGERVLCVRAGRCIPWNPAVPDSPRLATIRLGGSRPYTSGWMSVRHMTIT